MFSNRSQRARCSQMNGHLALIWVFFSLMTRGVVVCADVPETLSTPITRATRRPERKILTHLHGLGENTDAQPNSGISIRCSGGCWSSDRAPLRESEFTAALQAISQRSVIFYRWLSVIPATLTSLEV
ncbi:hypothetical protein FKP32DRAFT_875872 [Trametes sanguinea]|nr:hypothetical protein FKP32DRAFT_875872 [Trametes sanguinea]